MHLLVGGRERFQVVGPHHAAQLQLERDGGFQVPVDFVFGEVVLLVLQGGEGDSPDAALQEFLRVPLVLDSHQKDVDRFLDDVSILWNRSKNTFKKNSIVHQVR